MEAEAIAVTASVSLDVRDMRETGEWECKDRQGEFELIQISRAEFFDLIHRRQQEQSSYLTALNFRNKIFVI